MTQINIEKLRAMLSDWRGVLKERGRLVERLRQDLQRLKDEGKKADVDAVLAFYESVRLASMAAGKVDLLEELCGAKSPPNPIRNDPDLPAAGSEDERFTL